MSMVSDWSGRCWVGIRFPERDRQEQPNNFIIPNQDSSPDSGQQERLVGHLGLFWRL
jgi:hypothetical protein